MVTLARLLTKFESPSGCRKLYCRLCCSSFSSSFL